MVFNYITFVELCSDTMLEIQRLMKLVEQSNWSSSSFQEESYNGDSAITPLHIAAEILYHMWIIPSTVSLMVFANQVPGLMSKIMSLSFHDDRILLSESSGSTVNSLYPFLK